MLGEPPAEKPSRTGPLDDVARAKLAAIVDGAHEAIIGTNVAGMIESWNKGAEELYGYTATEMIGRNIDVLAPPRRKREVADIIARIARGERIDNYETRRVTKDGRLVDVEMILSPIDVDGVIVGIAAIVHSIVRRRRYKARNKLQASIAELEQRERDMEVLTTVSENLQACNSSDEAYPIIGAAVGQLFPQSSGALAVAVTGAHDLETVARWGEHLAVATMFGIDDCWALRRSQIHHFTGPLTPTCRHFSVAQTAPYFCLPLLVHGETFGLLCLAVGPDTCESRTRRLLEAMGESVKLALANLKLRERLSAQALRDPLTGLYNRQHLADTLPRELQRADRHGSHVSLIMLDVDHFKSFNDTYGHEAGDEVLRALGKVLKTRIRGSDAAFRTGGEEFILMLPDCDAVDACAVADHIRGVARTQAIRLHGQDLPGLALSAGVSEFPRHGTSAEDLIGAADKALLQAKEAGRDCVRIFDDALPKTGRPNRRAKRAAARARTGHT